MKLVRWVFIILLLGGAGYGYYYYKTVYSVPKAEDPVDLVPDNAFIVLETKAAFDNLEALNESEVMQQLSGTPVFKKYDDALSSLNVLLRGEGSAIKRFFSKDDRLIVCFQLLKNEVVPLVLVGINESEIDVIEAVLEKKANASEISFAGADIKTFKSPLLGTELKLVILDKVMAISTDLTTIQDLIKTRNSGAKTIFKTNFKELTDNEAETEAFHVYVDFAHLTQVYGEFNRGGQSKTFDAFAGYGFYDLNPQKDELKLSGYIYEPDTLATFVGSFQSQEPTKFSISDLISMNTAYVYYWGFSDYRKLMKSLESHWYSTNKHTVHKQSEVDVASKGELKKVQSFIKNDVAIAVQKTDGRVHDRIIYIGTTNPLGFRKQLDIFNKSINKLDTLNVEAYSNGSITELDVSEFPAVLFGDHFEGFPKSYYTNIGNQIIISNSPQALKLLINDITEGNTWGNSIEVSKFIEGATDKACVGVLINTARSWNSLDENLSMAWLDFFRKNKKDILSNKWISIQFEPVENGKRMYASLSAKFESNGTPVEVEETKDWITNQIQVELPVVSGPFITVNHTNGNRELLYQTSDFNLQLSSWDGKKLWSKKLDSVLVCAPTQIDVYRNRKLQFLCATSSKVYLIDRNGKDVDRYPYSLPQNATIENLKAIDYDGSRKYRIAATDTAGGIYLFDTKAKNLDGWKPNNIGTSSLDGATHIRVLGKDFIYAIADRGKVNVFNRRGKSVKNFPIELSGPVRELAVPTIGSSLRKSYLSVLTEEGEYYQISFQGKLIKNEKVPGKNSGNVSRMLKRGKKEAPWFAVISANEISVMDDKFNLKFKTKVGSVDRDHFNNLSFGNSIFYTQLSLHNEQFFLLGESGNVLIQQELSSPVSMVTNFDSREKVIRCVIAQKDGFVTILGSLHL